MTEIVPLTDVTEVLGSKASDSLRSVQGGVITIGNFDGVHRGHAALLSEVRRLADRTSGPAVAVVLDPHPASILRPAKAPTRLTWIERRAELMDRLGIDALVVCKIDREFLAMQATEFFQSLVIDRLAARAMVEGPNFFFGHNRGGDVDVLRELCGANQIDLQIVPPTKYDGQMISSTRIRNLLESGRVEEATRLLGAAYRIGGTVVPGDSRGRQIGFPTANLSGIDVVLPAAGVYGGLATAGEKTHQAAIHIGPAPTFDRQGLLRVEVHLLDYDGDLYDQVLLVDFIMHVRDIARFDSAQRLVEQLHNDVTTIRAGLAPFHAS